MSEERESLSTFRGLSVGALLGAGLWGVLLVIIIAAGHIVAALV